SPVEVDARVDDGLHVVRADGEELDLEPAALPRGRRREDGVPEGEERGGAAAGPEEHEGLVDPREEREAEHDEGEAEREGERPEARSARLADDPSRLSVALQHRSRSVPRSPRRAARGGSGRARSADRMLPPIRLAWKERCLSQRSRAPRAYGSLGGWGGW